MAIVARKADDTITSLKDLKGKKIGILPGTTQQVFFYERLNMEGIKADDIVAVRVASPIRRRR
jgi:ABC-type nitrate/sulfonate/bicarbonate transport system substrate-binding protein